MEECMPYQSVTARKAIGCGNVYVTIAFNGKDVSNVFPTVGKGCTCRGILFNVMGSMVGESLRMGMPLASVISVLKGTCCPEHQGKRSCMDAIAEVLQEHGFR